MAERGGRGSGHGSLDKSITLPPDEIFRNLENAKRFAIDIGNRAGGCLRAGGDGGERVAAPAPLGGTRGGLAGRARGTLGSVVPREPRASAGGRGLTTAPGGLRAVGAARGTTGVVVPPPGAGAVRAGSGTTGPGRPRAGNGPRGAGRGGPAGAALGGQGGTGESPRGSAGPAGGRRGWGASAAPTQGAPGPAPVLQARVRSPSAAPGRGPRDAAGAPPAPQAWKK